jgi:hypothetical protein
MFRSASDGQLATDARDFKQKARDLALDISAAFGETAQNPAL